MLPLLLSASLLMAGACTSAKDNPDDSGTAGGDSGLTTDGGSIDGGSADGGSPDGGTTDGGAPDGGAPDGGAPDGGAPDGGAGDGGSTVELAADFALAENEQVSTILQATWTMLEPADAVWLSFDVDGDVLTTPPRALEVGAASEALLGIPAETDVTVTLHVQQGDSVYDIDFGTGTSGALPDDLDLPDVTIWDPLHADPSPYALVSVNVGSYDFYGPCYTVIMDRQGNIVWYTKTSGSRLTLFPRVSRDGTHVTYDATVYYVRDDPSITRLTLDRRLEDEIMIPDFGFTYDELDDGSFVFDAGETAYDYFLDRLYPDGTRERLWDCNAWMDAYTTQYWACAVNTVLWSPERNTILWSMFETSTVAEIDVETGERLRYFGQTPDGWEIVPESSMLELQHYPNWTPDGHIITTTHLTSGPARQVIREFALDDTAETVTEVWSYTPDAGYYGSYSGDVERLESGNTMIGYGTAGVIQEITADSDVAWEVEWGGHLTGHLTLIDDLYTLNEGW